MKVAFINPFLLAIHQVFDTMVHVPVKLGKPCLKGGVEPSLIVSAVIRLSGPVTGSVALRLTQKAALALASGLSGGTMTVLDDDCLDAIGEIASIVSGNAKRDLSAQQTQITTPEVSIGLPKDMASMAPTIVIPCATTVGNFVLEVSLGEASGGK